MLELRPCLSPAPCSAPCKLASALFLGPSQMVVEKQLAAEGKDRRSMGREAFEAEVRGWVANRRWGAAAGAPAAAAAWCARLG